MHGVRPAPALEAVTLRRPTAVSPKRRVPALPVAELKKHRAAVNTLAWAPHSSRNICTAGDDAQALIWDLSSVAQPGEDGMDPMLAYNAGAEISQLQWSATQTDWIAIAFGKNLQVLHV